MMLAHKIALDPTDVQRRWARASVAANVGIGSLVYERML